MVSDQVSDMSVSVEPRIAAVGVGGAGCNVVSRICDSLCPIDTIAINTDRKALESISADMKLFICKEVTKGEGTRGDVRLGKKCAKVHEEAIQNTLRGYDAVFIVTGLGGGTGTGATSVVAEICNRLGIMTFAIAIKPFSFESDRLTPAGAGLRALRAVCRNIITIENDKIPELMPSATLDVAMRAVNDSIRDFVMEAAETVSSSMLKETESAVRRMISKDKPTSHEMPGIDLRAGLWA